MRAKSKREADSETLDDSTSNGSQARSTRNISMRATAADRLSGSTHGSFIRANADRRLVRKHAAPLPLSQSTLTYPHGDFTTLFDSHNLCEDLEIQ